MSVYARLARRHLPRSILMLVLCASATAAGTPFELPPLGTTGPAEHHTGKIIWADLVTPDLAAAEKFYSGLFGWTFKNIRAGDVDYAVAMFEGRPIAGLLQRPIPAGEHHQPAWLSFISVRDVDAALHVAVAHGAKGLSAARTYAGRGRQAVFADPSGAVVAMLASKSGDPPDFLAAPGEWIWSSLMTHDPAASAGFYKAVFGYDVFDLPSDDGAMHVILSSDDYARAGVNTLPSSGRRHPHWLNFVRVIDAADACRQAAALGGRVLVEPHIDRHGGQLAVVADPTGAPIGLMEWSETDSNVEPK
jgi:predicted enzyme related to lactoylglutathione lyase